jgi:hypothetical protein
MVLVDRWRTARLCCATCGRDLGHQLDWHVVFSNSGDVFGAIGACCAGDAPTLKNSLIDALMADDSWRRRCSSPPNRPGELFSR